MSTYESASNYSTACNRNTGGANDNARSINDSNTSVANLHAANPNANTDAAAPNSGRQLHAE